MGFLSWPNKALANMGFFKTNLVSNWGGPVEKKEWEKKRKRKRRWRSQDQGQKGMETHLDHEFYVIMYEFPCYWMVVSYP